MAPFKKPPSIGIGGVEVELPDHSDPVARQEVEGDLFMECPVEFPH